jgi:hypothetical protein
MLFAGFGGTCEARNNGDVVVRYDQLANRWLFVMPIFRRDVCGPISRPCRSQGAGAGDVPGVARQPAARHNSRRRLRACCTASSRLLREEPAPPAPQPTGRIRSATRSVRQTIPPAKCYRYEFLRPLFPDYPRPAVWSDGYYVPTSTGDDVIEHACVVERAKMLKGEPAPEQCLIIGDVNFSTTRISMARLPPARAPNMMLATGARS